jgi:hypothetical protein
MMKITALALGVVLHGSVNGSGRPRSPSEFMRYGRRWGSEFQHRR